VLLTRDEFVLQNGNDCLAICGYYVQGDAVHVGIYWNSENEKRIFHFVNANKIPIEDANLSIFSNYYFSKISDFNIELLPVLAATAELVSENKLNDFSFNRVGAYYDGGKFEFHSGAFTGKTTAEKYVNCGVFAFAFLKTFDHTLIDWQSWPDVDRANLNFLENWLEKQAIPLEERHTYYNKTKIVRGKHILVSPLTKTQPSPYSENEPMAYNFIRSTTC
jgi:hypothetical protein